MGGTGVGSIAVLHVDDEPDVAELTARYLEREHGAISVVTETSAPDGLDRLREEEIDCVVSDYQMPGMDGLEFLEAVREEYPDLPFILFTGKGSEEVASAAISAGVTDYLRKETGTEQYTVLARQIENVVARRRAEQRYRSFLEAAPDGIVIVNGDGEIKQVNEQAEELFGYGADELVGEPVEVLIPEPVRERHVDYREAYMEDPETRPMGADLDLYALTSDGEEVPVDISLSPMEVGESVEVIAAVRDISERKWRERELREERAFTESVFAALPDAFYAFDAEGNFLRWNDRFEEVTGYSSEEIEEMEPVDFVPDDEAGKIADAIGTVLEERRPVTVESAFETKDGERIPYEFTGGVLRDPETDELLGITGVGRDISERKERERRYEAIFDHTYQFTGLLEPDGTLIEANEAALEFGGLDREDVVGEKVWDTYWFAISEDTRERVKRDVERAAEGEFVRYELEVQGADRTAIIDFSLRPVTDEDGEVSLIVPEGRDITELKERERELQRQNERLDEFASVVSHDLRNPLHVARAGLDLARETGDEEAFRKVEDAHDRIEQLSEDLLTLARKGQVVSETEPVALRRVAEEAWRTTRTDDATLEFDDEVEVDADEDRLRELLENLFRNAVEHGSTSSLSPADDDPDAGVDVWVGSLAGDEGFYVADDGPGIPEAERDRVFDSDYTTTDRGTGFGLAIVSSIAEAHGWEVDVAESEAGGARFEVTTAG